MIDLRIIIVVGISFIFNFISLLDYVDNFDLVGFNPNDLKCSKSLAVKCCQQKPKLNSAKQNTKELK